MHFLLNIVAAGQESSIHDDLEQCKRAKELEFICWNIPVLREHVNRSYFLFFFFFGKYFYLTNSSIRSPEYCRI